MRSSEEGKVGTQGEDHQRPGCVNQIVRVGKPTACAEIFQGEGIAEGWENEETQETGMCKRVKSELIPFFPIAITCYWLFLYVIMFYHCSGGSPGLFFRVPFKGTILQCWGFPASWSICLQQCSLIHTSDAFFWWWKMRCLSLRASNCISSTWIPLISFVLYR